ncbi:MAG: ComEC/Rec2 family competence protein [bacterium]|nr:ComEC/Rec2 family competence protein [bacterium]
MGLLLTVVGGFAGGILLRSLFVFSWPSISFALLLGTLVLVAWFFAKRKTYLLVALFLLAGVLGATRFHLADTLLPKSFVSDIGERVMYEGTVVAEPDMRDASQRITLAVEQGSEVTRMLAVAERYPSVAYGDRVRVEGTLKLPEPFDTDTGRVFRYDKYLQKDGVRFLLHFATVDVVMSAEGFSLYGVLYNIKHVFNEALSHALPEPAASLASGLILGGKQGLGEELKQTFTVAGLIHIVVLSGYNVMIVAIAVMRLLVFLPRRAASALAAVTIGLFVLMAGAGAASVRAGAMAALGLYARATARTFDALRALLVVGAAMILWNPFVLVFDPGFQLSFIATLGLILGAPLVATRLAFIKNEFLREIAASTIAAQIAVLPLLFYQTGLFSAVALPANLLVLPVIPFAMGLSFFAGAAAFVLPPLATAVGLPSYAVLAYIITVTKFLAALPLASFSFPAFPFALVVLAYAVLGYFVWSKRFSTTAQFKLLRNAST